MKSRKRKAQRSHKLETFEARSYMAAHIVGNATSYATIQAAVNAALPNAVINVDAGTYNETVSIYQPVTIRGAQAGVDARNTRGAESIVYATQTVFDVRANDVTIDGFTIQGNRADIGAQLGAGVLMRPNIHGTHVLDNIIQNNVTGIYLSNNSNTDAAIIQHNLIQNNFEKNNYWTKDPGENGSRGIYTDGTVSGGYLTNALIDANTLFNSDFNGGDEDMGMISLQALTAGKQFNITITNNYIGNESKALLATNVTNLVFMGNTCTALNDGSSGPVRFEGNANTVNIQYNTITGNSGPGVAVDSSGVPGDSSGFVVNNNNIYGNNGIGFITQAGVYNGPITLIGDWWGSASGPSGVGPGTGVSVWANGISGHSTTPKGLPGGGPINFSPWATSLIDITKIPAPAAPTGLTTSVASSSSALLSWTPQMSTATSQLIQRSVDGVNFVTVATVPPLLNSFTDTGLTTGTAYVYRIVAANPTGNSAPSNTSSTTPPAYKAPVAPSGLTAKATTATTITLNWTPPANATGIASYTVYRNGVAIGTSATTTFTDTGLAPVTAYTYTVATTDTTNATSAPGMGLVVSTATTQITDGSFETTQTTGYVYNPVTSNWTFTDTAGLESNGSAFSASNAPDGTQAAFIQGNAGTLGKISQTFLVNPAGTYTLSFSAAQRAGYNVLPISVIVDGTVIGTVTPTGTAFATYTSASFTLTAGSHTIAFAATSASGDRTTFVDSVKLTLVAQNSVPAAPTNLVATTLSATQIKLTWAAAATLTTGYTLQRSTDNATFTNVTTAIAAAATTYTDTTAAAGTTYFYRLIATNAVGSSPASTIATAATIAATAVTSPLSGLTWTSATTGYGTAQKNTTVVGNTITLRGVTYASGVGTHAASTIVYNLAGKYATFLSDVGIDDEVPNNGVAAVQFQVYGDGVLLFDSGVLSRTSAAASVAVSVAGVQTLTLVATNGVAGSIDYDHADWAGARLVANAQVPSAPTAVTAAGLTTTSIKLGWTSPTSGSAVTGYKVERSLDGTTWTPVATVGASTLSYTDSGLTTGTSYSYRVRATSAVGDSANSAVITAKPLSATAVTTNLSSLNWTTATAGYGTTQKNLSVGGNAINLAGTAYTTGIGTHAASSISYNLNGAYTTFTSDVGFDNEVAGRAATPVDFQVIGDGKVLFDSGAMTNTGLVVSVNVDVTGVKTLTLVANNIVAGSIDYDHVDWAGAKLISPTALAPTAPTGVTATATGTNAISLAWTNTASGATGLLVQRSTDGVTFTTVATLGGTASNYSDTVGLTAGTTYTYQVLAVTSGVNSVASAKATATTVSASAVTTALSTLAWTSATSGWGSAQNNITVAGNTIKLRGTTYASGVGTHAASTIVYNLAGKYTGFLSDFGVDDEVTGIGSVDFQVIGDGKVLFDSGVVTSLSAIGSLNVNVTGVQTLTLIANSVNGDIDFAHADWAGARLLSAPAAAPAAQIAAVAAPDAAAPVVAMQKAAVPAVAPTVPTPMTTWKAAPLGTQGLTGSLSSKSSVVTIKAASTGIGGKADGAYFAYQAKTGDFTITAEVDASETGKNQAGLMIRDNVSANARMVSLVLGGNKATVTERTAAGATAVVAKTAAVAKAPEWLKVVRKGNVFTESVSSDHKHWTTIASINVGLSSSVLVGMAVASGLPTTTNTATFSSVTIV